MNQPIGNQGIVMYGGNINAKNIAAGSRATIIDASRVQPALQRLREDIRTLPENLSRERDELEEYRNAVEMEASKPEPKRSLLEVNAKKLIETAKTVAEVAPGILAGAEHVAKWVATLL